jgi:hypothetical protein
MGSDHIPRAPPIACSLRFVRMGRSRCQKLSDGTKRRNVLRPTWNSANPPRGPEPVAATSSGTERSYKKEKEIDEKSDQRQKTHAISGKGKSHISDWTVAW